MVTKSYVYTIIRRKDDPTQIDGSKVRTAIGATTSLAMRQPEAKAKQSAGQKRRFRDLGERERMSAAKKGKKLTAEHKAKIGAAHLGQKRSLEARAKMSAWQIGRKMSVETRAKMSAAAKARCATPAGHEQQVRRAKAGAARRWK